MRHRSFDVAFLQSHGAMLSDPAGYWPPHPDRSSALLRLRLSTLNYESLYPPRKLAHIWGHHDISCSSLARNMHRWV
jgi:hypothetical protein